MHSFSTYVLNTEYVPGSVQNIRDAVMNMTDNEEYIRKEPGKSW